MTWNPASPVTGAPGTGLTSPTYTLATDVAPRRERCGPSRNSARGHPNGCRSQLYLKPVHLACDAAEGPSDPPRVASERATSIRSEEHVGRLPPQGG
jgi:hypothetical protein